jgi:Resolvase, N terminal domain
MRKSVCRCRGPQRMRAQAHNLYAEAGFPAIFTNNILINRIRIEMPIKATRPVVRHRPEQSAFHIVPMSRSTRDLLKTMETIRKAERRFQSISEPWADTTSHSGKMIMTIFAGIAEFGRELIRERTGAGREAAKKRGVRFGRPRKLALDQDELARRLVSEGRSVREIAAIFNRYYTFVSEL